MLKTRRNVPLNVKHQHIWIYNFNLPERLEKHLPVFFYVSYFSCLLFWCYFHGSVYISYPKKLINELFYWPRTKKSQNGVKPPFFSPLFIPLRSLVPGYYFMFLLHVNTQKYFIKKWQTNDSSSYPWKHYMCYLNQICNIYSIQ